MASNTLSSQKKSFRIIESLIELDGGRISEIASHLGLPKSTVHSHLTTLCETGYVTKSGDDYQVGLKFLWIGGYARKHMLGYNRCKETVKKIAQKTGERAQFTTEECGRQVTLFHDKGENAVQTDVFVGQRSFLHTTSSGKATLANLPKERQKEIISQGLPKRTEHTLTNPEQLSEELERVRQRGYAFNKGERVEKQYAVGVPVFGSNEALVGALSVSGPEYRMKGARMESELPELLLGYADELNLNIRYND